MRPPLTRAGIGAVAVLAATISLAPVVAAPTAGAARSAVRAAPALPRGARARGGVAPSTEVRLDVGLRVRDPAALAALDRALYDPASPSFHRFLARGVFARRFGATAAELARVERWLRASGLTPTGVSASRLTVHVTATASTIAAVLHAPLEEVRLRDGQVDFANRAAPVIPAPLASVVDGIVGLSDLPVVSDGLVHHRGVATSRAARVRTTGSAARACAAAVDTANVNGSFTVAGLASYYAITPLYALGDHGRGMHVAIAEFEPDRASDIAAYQRCYGTAASVAYHHVDGGVGSGAGEGEAALDIEDVIGMAPQASIDVYQGPVSSLGDDDLYAAIVSKDADQVVTTSYGLCEQLIQLDDPSLVAAESATFAQAQSQGQVVFAASGDSGSTDCDGDGDPTYNSALAVDDPASQPDVIGVGGTTATSHGEVVWNSQGSGSGGGVSVVECMSSTQDNALVPGVISGATTADETTCPTAPSYLREVPDVAAVADPSTGYTIYWAGSWGAIGGTSAAAPLWAAVAALIDDSPYCRAAGSSEGVTAASLYALAATSAFHEGLFDVTSGDNVVSGSGYTGSLYAATPGYDEATGLGTPQVTHYVGAGRTDLFHPGLASLLCDEQRTGPLVPTIAAVVPDRLASDLPTKVTVTGSGFLAVAGAVRLSVDGRTIDATCGSSTRCTAVIAPGAPTTVPVRLRDQTYAVSAATPADLVTFVAAPSVASMSPTSGRTAGATRVTIHGSGFTGRVSVHFGTRAATHVDVESATTLVVSAPAGTGTVVVTVTATGGVSHAVPADRYRYGG